MSAQDCKDDTTSRGANAGACPAAASAAPEAPWVCPATPFPFKIAALCVAAAGLLCALSFGLLPMVFGLLGSRAASLALAETRLLRGRGRHARLAASALVGALALGLCVGLSAWGFESATQTMREAPVLAKKLTEQAKQWKKMLPPAVADRIPEEDAALQAAVSELIAKQMPSIAGAGRSWGSGALMALVGWIVGLLMANMGEEPRDSGPLSRSLRERGRRFSSMFNQIVVAQFFVACANTLFATVYMLVLLPMFGHSMPWAPALIGMTLALSMIPVAGNVLCNGVVTLVALSVGPGLALASLAYLVLVHKVEYFINAKVVGSRVCVAIWELLLAMFVLDAIFGVGGIVAAPLFYAYAKSELKNLGWV